MFNHPFAEEFNEMFKKAFNLMYYTPKSESENIQKPTINNSVEEPPIP